MTSVNHLSWQSTLSKSGTSRPSVRIGVALYFNSFMTEAVMKELKWTGFYMITASAMKGLRFLMFHEPYLFLVWDFTTNMADCFPSSEIIVFGCYRTWISITFFRLCIGFNCNFYLVPNFCIWPTCFSIDMMPSTEDDFIKRVEFCFTEDVIFLLHVYENKLISCDLCWQSFIQYSVSRSIAIILLSIYVPFFAFSILWRFFFDKKEKSISRFAHQFCKISNGVIERYLL